MTETLTAEQTIELVKGIIQSPYEFKYRYNSVDLVNYFSSLITNIESLQAENKELLASEMAVNYQNEILANEDLKRQIESQKKEIEKLLSERTENETIIKRKLKIKQDCIDDSMTKIESLKAITELAVKGNENYKAQLKNAEAKEFAYDGLRKRFDMAVDVLNLIAKGNLGFPTWQDTVNVLKDVRLIAKDTLSEIERLSRLQEGEKP